MLSQLAGNLRNAVPTTRAQACRELAELPEGLLQKQAPQISQLLRDDVPEVRLEACRALNALPSVGLAELASNSLAFCHFLAELIVDPRSEARIVALEVLCKVPSDCREDQVPALARALQDQDRAVQLAACRVPWSRLPKPIGESLLELTNCEDDELQSMALSVLRGQASSVLANCAPALLLERLESESSPASALEEAFLALEDVSSATMASLAPAISGCYLGLVQKGTPILCVALCRMLCKLSCNISQAELEPAAAAVVTLLAYECGQRTAFENDVAACTVREEACQALAAAVPPPLLQFHSASVARCLKDPHAAVRAASCGTMSKLPSWNRAQLTALAGLLGDEAAKVRQAACEALLLASKDSLEFCAFALGALIQDSESAVRAAAYHTLALLPLPAKTPYISTLAAHLRDGGTDAEAIRRALLRRCSQQELASIAGLAVGHFEAGSIDLKCAIACMELLDSEGLAAADIRLQRRRGTWLHLLDSCGNHDDLREKILTKNVLPQLRGKTSISKFSAFDPRPRQPSQKAAATPAYAARRFAETRATSVNRSTRATPKAKVSVPKAKAPSAPSACHVPNVPKCLAKKHDKAAPLASRILRATQLLRG